MKIKFYFKYYDILNVMMILFFKEIFNGEVLFREDATADEFIDVIVGNRVYMPCLYVFLFFGFRFSLKN